MVQLNAFSDALREAAVDTLVSIGDCADGVRCDMAMLLMNDIFGKTWGDRAGTTPAEDFWPYVIPRVRARHPGLLFVAEAYWDLEGALQQQGFDHCYDKRLYDRLLHDSADTVRAHLGADPSFQRGLVRFLENHDELPGRRHPARRPGPGGGRGGGDPAGRDPLARGPVRGPPGAAARVPEAQAAGARRRAPARLLRPTAARRCRRTQGDWRPLTPTGRTDNDTYRDLLAWTWTHADARHLVVVNDSDRPARARLPLPWDDLRGRVCRATDLLTGAVYDRDGDELADCGLFVSLEGWGCHVLKW